MPVWPFLAVAFQDWTITAERTNFAETGRYQEAVDFCKRLARFSPAAKVITYGKSPEGRPMVALLISSDRQFSETAFTGSKKPLIFVQNGIHSGEIEGKDASLMLARDMLVQKKHAELLAGANWVIVPVFSLDAHERFGPYNRINQNGPTQMGWRATAQNLNLNRDWMKADSPEMRAEISLVQRYKPDIFFDNHTTDGADFQYVLTLGIPWGSAMPAETATWSKKLYDQLERRCSAQGFPTAPYFSMNNRTDPSRGITVSDYSPRFSHGYVSALNRPAILVETHVLKPYEPRVKATYSVMVETALECVRQAKELKAMNARADAAAASVKEGDSVVLTSELTNETEPFTFLAYPYAPRPSSITGRPVAAWDRTKPQTVATTVRWKFKPGLTVAAPAAYAVPPAWHGVIDRLKLHGVKSFTLNKPMTDLFWTERFEDVKFAPSPFESRQQPSFKSVAINGTRTLPAGTVIVPVAQPHSRLLIHLMEPNAPDSFVQWGFFNTIFESKEYAEDYAMEPYANKMLAGNQALAKEFAEALKDEKFAASASARLDFFYRRSPYFDDRLNKYPVVRLSTAQLLKAHGRN